MLLLTRTVDVVIGSRPAILDSSIASTHFLNYQVVAVAAPDHPITRLQPGVSALREQMWLLGPSAAGDTGVIPGLLRRINVPEDRQRIFQSHAAALEEAKRGKGAGPGPVVHRFAGSRERRPVAGGGPVPAGAGSMEHPYPE